MTISNNATGSRPGVCTSTTRPLTPYEGQQIYETDTDRVLVWNGSVWVMPNSTTTNRDGMQVVTPQSVTGGTILSDGSIQVNSSTTLLSVSGVFSSFYQNYKIFIANMTQGSGADYGFRLNNSTGNTYTTTNFYYQAGGSSLNVVNRSSQSFFLLTRTEFGTTEFSSEVTVYSPFILKRKSFSATTAGYLSGVSNGYDTSTVSSTGFSLLHGAPQGTEAFGNAIIRIYGLV